MCNIFRDEVISTVWTDTILPGWLSHAKDSIPKLVSLDEGKGVGFKGFRVYLMTGHLRTC